MRKLSSDRVKRAGESEGSPSGKVSALRSGDAEIEGADDVSPNRVSVTLNGCRPSNPLNGSQGRTRGGNIVRARKRKALRKLAAWSTRARLSVLPRSGRVGRLIVTLIRFSPRPYDSDGWQAAAKPIRDGVADALERRDNDPDIEWRYEQRRGLPKSYAVAIVVEAL